LKEQKINFIKSMDQFKPNIPIKTEDLKLGSKKQPWWRILAKVCALLILIIAAFVYGFSTGNKPSADVQQDNVIKYTADELIDIFKDNDEIDVELFTQVWDILHEDYLDKNKINDQDLFYGAVAGMVSALGDPHSSFFDPVVTEEFNQELNGSFHGIGAEIGRKNGTLVIIAPLDGTPAARAGLKSGDQILAVDGVDTGNISVTEAVNLIRGEKDTKVVLTIYSKDEGDTKEISIIRDKIDIPSVVYRLEDDIAIIDLTHFNNDTEDRFAKVAQKVLNDNPKGIILDLRNNPGGLLHIAVEITSYWLDPKQVVVRETFSDKRSDKDYKASKKISLADFDTIILVNEGSASAAEIVAGALQDYGKAFLVGKKTFGKGSVQQLISLKDDSSIKLTVARWLTPNGRTIDMEGIEPDTEVDLTFDDYNNDLDPQLDKAKELFLGL